MWNRLPKSRQRIVRIPFSFVAGILLLGGLLLGCRPAPLATLPDVIAESPGQPIPPEQAASTAESFGKGVADPIPTSTLRLPAASTASPEATITLSPTPKPSPLPTQTPTPTPIGPCSMRMPQDDLLAAVTLTYGLSRDYAPEDLVPLADELPMHVTMGYPSQIREVAFRPLVQMISDMQEEGLHPQILSAYRSYAAQAIAWDKWNELYPERAAIISAPPGYSEHQLGTVVDFGSPELASIVGQADIEFHTYFYKTSEGIWLDKNAHRYGFTLSFPAEASEVSGFFYEPWHFRYVGTEMATLLYEMDSSLTELKLVNQPEPCIP
jgi:D-alanyl-D-alanine carboxypeptidase